MYLTDLKIYILGVANLELSEMDGFILLCMMMVFTSNHGVFCISCPGEIRNCSCSENVHSELDVVCHGVKGIENILCNVCDNPPNVTSLDVNGASMPSIPPGCFNKCVELKRLSLVSMSIRTLGNDSLAGLNNLEELTLNNNALLQSSKSSTFETLKTLNKLNHFSIRNNSETGNMTVFNICQLCGFLRSVRVLDVSENIMNNVTPSCFERCSNLEKLYLESNNISQVNHLSFAGLSSLKYLNLDNNGVIVDGNVSHPDMFQPLNGLQELHVQKNVNVRDMKKHFTYLDNIGNNSLNNLRELYLDGLPNGVLGQQFQNFNHLVTLNFSGETSNCYIYSLTNSTFQNIANLSLIALHLSHCNISAIDAGTFMPLKEMRHLNLSFNMALGFPSLRNVSYGLQFTKIEVLDYSKVYKSFGMMTQINRCDVEFLQNTTLKEIHLNNNRLALIELNALMWLPASLEVVYAEDNNIQFGEYFLQFGCLCNLRRLEYSNLNEAYRAKNLFSECELKENKEDTSGGCPVTKSTCTICNPNLGVCPFSANLSGLTFPYKLETFSVRNSNLHSDFTGLKAPLHVRNSLRYFDISNNVFQNWTGSWAAFDNLSLLNLSYNFGNDISHEFFANIPNLNSLDASNNIIGPRLANDSDGKIFQNLTYLRYLNISNNWIEHLPFNIFKHTPFLWHLDLSFNRLENVSFAFEHLENLSHLYLQSNRISTVPIPLLKLIESNLNTSSQGIAIDLTKNILDGSCRNFDFISWMMEHKAYFSNVEDYQFLLDNGTRISFSAKYFETLEKHCQSYTSIFIVSICFIISFFGIILGGILHRYRWRIRYIYYMAKARYGGYIPFRDDEADDNYQYDIFISYANEDYGFVTGEMYQTLQEAGLSMCLHQKDFLPGSYISENILRAIRSSRKTVIVLSPAFLDSKWCMYEFNMARMEGIYGRNGESIIFVVMYEEIDVLQISEEMRDCLESESYLAYPQEQEERPYFWEMLARSVKRTG